MRIDLIAKTSALLAAGCACAAPALATAPGPGGLGYGAPVGDSLVVRSAAMLDNVVHLRGVLGNAREGDPVVAQRLLRDGSWETIAAGQAAADGSFTTTWRTNHIGRMTLRVVPAAIASAAVEAASVQATGRMTVYRPGTASYYGPGFYGRRTSCGQRLTRRTLGVAHPALPCGALVDLYYRGRTITVPVIDRGPFHPGRTWDLTSATATALHFTGVHRIGAVRAPAAP